MYEAALAVNPRYSDAANNLAMLLVNEDSTSSRALELAEMAKAASPDDPRISDTLGWVLYNAATTSARWGCSWTQQPRCRTSPPSHTTSVSRD